jgi:hypothetical protein
MCLRCAYALDILVCSAHGRLIEFRRPRVSFEYLCATVSAKVEFSRRLGRQRYRISGTDLDITDLKLLWESRSAKPIEDIERKVDIRNSTGSRSLNDPGCISRGRV